MQSLTIAVCIKGDVTSTINQLLLGNAKTGCDCECKVDDEGGMPEEGGSVEHASLVLLRLHASSLPAQGSACGPVKSSA